jgi:hypothetical protein
MFGVLRPWIKAKSIQDLSSYGGGYKDYYLVGYNAM